jgi:23S rRNA pseudouridine2604 synthase
MSFRRRVTYYLVHFLNLSHKDAAVLIAEGKVQINGTTVSENVPLDENAEIRVNNEIVRRAKEMVYLRFYKPAGFESSLNPKIKESLFPFFKGYKDISIAGRLDKASEGLMLLSNDGKWVENIINPKYEKEKEYIVELNKTPDSDFISDFSKGVLIGVYRTQPCFCSLIEDKTIKVILKEGKNRQIRKMCKTLGFNVIKLIRTRIDQFEAADLKPGEIGVVNI